MGAVATETKPWGRIEATVGVTLFLCLFAAQAGLIALTPVLAKVADDLDVSTATAGQLRTASGLGAGLAAIALGTFARRIPLRRVIAFGTLGLAAASALSAAAPTFAVLLVAQVILGLSIAGLLVGGTVAAAEWLPQEHRTRALSWALVGPPAAWIVGMPLIGAIGELGWRWTWLALPLVAAVVAGIAVAVRPASQPRPDTESLTTALRDRQTALWVAAELLATSAWVGTLVFSGALFTETYGTTTFATGILLAAGAAAYVAGNVLFRRMMTCRPKVMLVRLSLGLAVGVALFGAIRSAVWVSVLFFSVTAFVAGGRMLIGSAVGLEAAAERRRAVMGSRAAAQQLGYFVGSSVAGAALAAGGYPLFGFALAALFVASTLPFLVGAPGRRTTLRVALLEPPC
jgi:predicted MFS family arabinose efflux permease